MIDLMSFIENPTYLCFIFFAFFYKIFGIQENENDGLGIPKEL
jgi:hypothetical protein